MEHSIRSLAKRLIYDLLDRRERHYYGWWLIAQIPCLFGDMLRARYCAKRFKRAGRNLRVLAGTRFRSMERIEVGNNVSIGFDNFIQAFGGLIIGDNVLLGPGVKIWTVNHGYDLRDKLICEQAQVKKPVRIGDDVWIGANTSINPGVDLPDGCVVAAGSVVNKKVYKQYSIIAGNPGRIIGFRGSRIVEGGNK